ncbi:MAG: regulatory protein RecX [Actinomycetota bacterium]
MTTRERPAVKVKERALRLLSVRSRSKSELRQRLLRSDFEPEEVDSALADLEAVGLIDDEEFARELAEHQRRKGLGRRAALAGMRVKGVDRDLAERIAEEVSPEDEAERAAELAAKRLPRLQGIEPEVRRRRLMDYLLRRGYDHQTALAACIRAMAEEVFP